MEPFAPAKWGELAKAFGLALHDPVGPYGAGLTFKGLKRILGPTARAVTSAWQWMYGRHRNVEVVLAPWLGQKAISVVARIDPPLFLGLQATRNADRFFDFAAYDRDRARAAIDAARTSLGALAAVAKNARISDSAVAIDFFQEMPDDDALARALDEAVGTASKLSELRRRLERSDAELAQEATWRAFAETLGMTFDVDRMEMAGSLAGSRMRITLETEPAAAVTSVAVDLPGSLGIKLGVTKQTQPTVINALTGVVDLPTGDLVFDEAFVLRGDPAVDAQRLFFDATLRSAVFDLGRAAMVFELGDAHLYARYATALGEGELGRLADRLVTVIMFLFPKTPRDRPYR